MSEQADSLGLDKPIKLGRPLRIPKVTDELLFENIRGLPQIRQNYRALSKAFRHNDKRYAEKSKTMSKSAAQQLKITTESENLKKVLSFYQLWCHGLFPRANFEDCVSILRNHKSKVLRDYRRSLVDAEIKRIKIEKGIIVEDDDSDNASDTEPPVTTTDPAPSAQDNTENDNAPYESDEDDWGFLSVNRRSTNGLFIGEEDDAEENQSSAPATTSVTAPAHTEPEDIDFDDFDENDFLPSTTQHAAVSDDDDHQAELDIMNEMGM